MACRVQPYRQKERLLFRRRTLAAAACAVVCFLTVGVAHADDEDEDGKAAPPDPAFTYTKPASPNYVRAAVEDATILGLGYLQYTTNKANQEDWDLTADWPSMRRKLTLQAVTFDNNRYWTNMATHPLAGVGYYTVARSNRLGVLPSFLFAFGASTFWEYVGEWREEASINDIIVTPMTGMAMAEPLLQFGSLMQRSRPSTLTRSLGWFFAPVKGLHDNMDGLDPKQAEVVDRLGLPAEEYHRFALGAGVGVTHQARGLTQNDATVHLDTRVVTLPDYGGVGRREGWFRAAEATEMHASITASSEEVVDFQVAGALTPVGYRWQDVELDGEGRRRGSSFLGGLYIRSELAQHDYDRDRIHVPDRLSFVAAGPTLEEFFYAAGFTIRARLDVLASFANVDAYALADYDHDKDRQRLTSVLRFHGYYYGIGPLVQPTLQIERGPFEVGAALRGDAYVEITEADVEPTKRPPELEARDRRLWSRVWLAASPTDNIRIWLQGDRRGRDGTMPGEHVGRSELSASFGVDLLF